MYAEHTRQHYLSLINLIQRVRNLSVRLKATTSTVEPAGGDTSKSKKCPNCGETTPNHVIIKCPAYGSEC